MRQLPDRAVFHAKGVNLAAFERVLGIRRAIGGGKQPFAIGSPGRSAPALQAGGVIVVTT